MRRGMNKTNIVRAYFVDGDFPVCCKKGVLFGVGIYAKLVLTTARFGQFEESFVGSNERFWEVHKLVNWNRAWLGVERNVSERIEDEINRREKQCEKHVHFSVQLPNDGVSWIVEWN